MRIQSVAARLLSAIQEVYIVSFFIRLGLNRCRCCRQEKRPEEVLQMQRELHRHQIAMMSRCTELERQVSAQGVLSLRRRRPT